MSDPSRADILYRRATGFARFARIAGIVMIVVGLAYVVINPFIGVIVGAFGSNGDLARDPFYVLTWYIRTWLASGVTVLALGILTLVAARAAGGAARPAWAPLLDERFARKADIFALVSLGFAGIYAMFSAIDIPANAVRLSKLLGGNRPTTVIDYVLSQAVGALSTFFFFVAGALIVQALVLAATREYGPDEPKEPPRHEE